jgi:hypothetical protein
MIKAGALYMVVIVSLLIAMVSASLLTIAFFYRQEVQKKVRQDKLLINLESGTAVLLSDGFAEYDQTHHVDLFDAGTDSLTLRKELWGVYGLNLAKAFELKDTLKRAFLSANTFTDQHAIYLTDEDRPLSVSGNTQITGNGQLPKSGLRQAYVDGKPYTGKALINGDIHDSGRDLPPLDEEMIQDITYYLKPLDNKKNEFKDLIKGLTFDVQDSLNNSFFNDAKVFYLDETMMDLGSRKLRGKIILVSDTILKVAADSHLDQVQIYAPAIIVASGFKGNCQLFARDSIIIGKDCVFDYPSFAGIFKPEDHKIQAKLSIGEGSLFSGVLLSYEKKRSPLQTIISLSKGCKVNGEVFATGFVKLEKRVSVNGKTYAKRFIMQTPTTLYENYLIDVNLNRKLLSKYYLSSSIFKGAGKGNVQQQKILKWLE